MKFEAKMEDKLILGNKSFKSRFIMGSGKFDPNLIKACTQEAGAEIITLALRRVNLDKNESILSYIPKEITLLPNTSGARNANETLRIARLSRELGCGDFVKVEIIRDSKYLFPDNYETLKSIELLRKENFYPLVYMLADLTMAKDMQNAGASAIMPLASPIGSNQGLVHKEMIQILINEIDLPIIVDAGLGSPSAACEAMQMGAAAVMVNTAIATANDIFLMARAFKDAVIAGRNGYLAGLGRVRKEAEASSPLTGFLENLDEI